MTSPPFLDCGVCRLRQWSLDDKTALVRNANNRNIWRNVRDLFPFPYTEADAERWLPTVIGPATPEWHYAIDVAGEAAGGVALRRGTDVNRFTVEIGYWLGEKFWGQGIMSAVVRTLTARALEEPNIYRVEAAVFAWNAASMRILEKAGYRREGVLKRNGVKDGNLMDEALYAVTRDPGLPYVSIDA